MLVDKGEVAQLVQPQKGTKGSAKERERGLVQFVEFGGGGGAKFEICDGGGVIAQGGDERVVTEVTTAASDDDEISGLELL